MIRIDWRGYFREFCEKHGGNPVEIGNRLVFADGWSYANKDYRGPEWPPPDDPVIRWRLQHEYWKRRCAILRRERDKLAKALEGVAEQQLRRDGELKMFGIETYTDEEGRERARLQSAGVNWEHMQVRVRFLTEDLQKSEAELRTLEGFVPTE